MPKSWMVHALVLLAAGCSDQQIAAGAPADGLDPREISVEREPGMVRIINREPQLPAGSWRIGEVPRLRIGAVDGEEEYLFREVVHAHRLEDASILVVNAGGGTVLRVYSPAGEYIRGYGRQGRGPGEFGWVTAQRVSADTILLHDGILDRLTLATATEGAIRSWPVPPTVTPPLYVADGAQIWIIGQSENALPEGHHRLYRSFVLGSTDGPGNDTIGIVVQSEVIALPGAADGRRLVPVRVPYTLPSRYGYDWVHGRLVTNQAGADLTYLPVLARDAEAMEVILAGRSRAVTEEDWHAALDFELELERIVNQQRCPDCVRVRDQARRGASPPEFMPGYDAFLFDRRGNTWARVYERPYPAGEERPREWRVIDGSGRWIVSVELPHDVEPLDIGDDYMLAQIRIDLDVQAVGLFDLRKN